MAVTAVTTEMVVHWMESTGAVKLTTIAIQVQIATSQLNISFLTFGNAIVGNRFVVILHTSLYFERHDESGPCLFVRRSNFKQFIFSNWQRRVGRSKLLCNPSLQVWFGTFKMSSPLLLSKEATRLQIFTTSAFAESCDGLLMRLSRDIAIEALNEINNTPLTWLKTATTVCW